MTSTTTSETDNERDARWREHVRRGLECAPPLSPDQAAIIRAAFRVGDAR
ncbi:hypothetical protein [Mycolicibacterium hippocampi]|uniref:Uncharacterized protein n=1 Tax=Mycolicibacterium hippocampi TaxID=659824 RepID=A0A7I9ZRC1_9MYCO|nr:hypothetical protein [Mycolicibacterium hippocampi]GFH03389.1 hypothetical protein MHIP_38720 [Mycolicibacterium hippocampi]